MKQTITSLMLVRFEMFVDCIQSCCTQLNFIVEEEKNGRRRRFIPYPAATAYRFQMRMTF